MHGSDSHSKFRARVRKWNLRGSIANRWTSFNEERSNERNLNAENVTCQKVEYISSNLRIWEVVCKKLEEGLM